MPSAGGPLGSLSDDVDAQSWVIQGGDVLVWCEVQKEVAGCTQGLHVTHTSPVSPWEGQSLPGQPAF